MSLLGLFGLVDLYFLAILLHPKVFSNGIIVQNEYQNELDDPQVFDGQSHFKWKHGIHLFKGNRSVGFDKLKVRGDSSILDVLVKSRKCTWAHLSNIKLSWNLTLACELAQGNQFSFQTKCPGFIEPITRFVHDSLKHCQHYLIWPKDELEKGNMSKSELYQTESAWFKSTLLTAHYVRQWEGDWLTKCHNEWKIILAAKRSEINRYL